MTTSIGASSNSAYSLDSTQNSKTSTSANVTMAQLMQALLESFAQSYSKTSESSDDKEKKQMIKDLVSKADTDKDGALSMDELSKVDTSENQKETNLVDELIRSFKTLDTNCDGELSIKEMQELIKRKAFSQQELADMSENSDQLSSISSVADSTGKISSLLADKLISSYDAANL